jgi:benzoate membrane transport protein
VLARFGLDAASRAPTAPLLVVVMLLAYLAGAALVAALRRARRAAGGRGGGRRCRGASHQPPQARLARPVFTRRTFSASAFVGVALPLFVVTMASQNLPGVAAQRAAGSRTPVSPVIAATGLAGLVLAPFGGYAFNLAAITAAICMGREAHEDPAAARYTAAVGGVFYLLVGLAGGGGGGRCSRRCPRSWCWRWRAWRCWAPSAAGWRRAEAHEANATPRSITFLVTLSRRDAGRHRLGLLGRGGRPALRRRPARKSSRPTRTPPSR